MKVEHPSYGKVRCEGCGYVYWVTRAGCPSCLAPNLHPRETYPTYGKPEWRQVATDAEYHLYRLRNR